MVISVYFSESKEQFFTVYDFPNDVKYLIGKTDYHNRHFVYSIDLSKLSKNKKYLRAKRYKEPLRKRVGNLLINLGYKIRDKNTQSHITNSNNKKFPWWLLKR